jgi:RND family efflux transporter MFP subunit
MMPLPPHARCCSTRTAASRRPPLLAVSLLSATCGLLAACAPSQPPVADSAAPRPALVVSVRESTDAGAPLTGEVRAVHRAEPGFAVAGVVTEVLVRAGERVRVGQVLARLDAAPFVAQRLAAQAEEAKAKAMHDEAGRRLARVEAAQAAGAVSPGEISAAGADVASALAALRAAKAQVDQATWSFEQATLRAGIAGTVGARHIEPGHTVAAGAPAFALDGAGRELVVLAPGDLHVVVGQAVQVQRAGQALPARVQQLATRRDVGGARRVTVSVPDDAVVGETWSVRLSDPTRPVVARVPARAVLRLAAPDTGTVLRLGGDGTTVERVTVTLGRLHQDTVEVLTGLAPSDRVVLAGASGIQPGTRVKPVSATPGAPS